MKVPVDKFVATMKKYNEYCEKGVDLGMYKSPEYLIPFKKPPYYAFWLQNFANTTHNGIVINENMELVNAKDKKGIPNPFAAGYNAQVMDGGMGWCPTSGYMAGIAEAKYLGYVWPWPVSINIIYLFYIDAHGLGPVGICHKVLPVAEVLT